MESSLAKKKRFKFHLIGLVHLPVSEKYPQCAYTQKIVKLSKMLLDLKHDVILYGAKESDAPCSHLVRTHSLKDIRDTWGSGDNRYDLGYNYKKYNFRHDFNKTPTPLTIKFIKKCISEINKTKKPDDFLLLTQGFYQKPIADAVKMWLTCEPGIGYRGSFTRFRAFESSYLQNFTYGSQDPFKSINGDYYSRVIPNYFDPKDFTYSKKKDDYFLFIGRLITRKGLQTAHLVTKEIGAKLKVAGQGMRSWDGHKLVTEELTIEGDNIDFVGCVDVEARKTLYAKAKATFVATTYLEPFGGTSIESLFSGTPVITTNFGVFPETIPSGLVGYRCNTLDDFVQAARQIDRISPQACRDYAMKNFSMDEIKWKFERWFQDLYDLYLSAQTQKKQGWHKIYPKTAERDIRHLIQYYPSVNKGGDST